MTSFFVSEFSMLAQLLVGTFMLCPQDRRREHSAPRICLVVLMMVVVGILSSLPFTLINQVGSNWVSTLFFALTLALFFPAVLVTYDVSPWQAAFFCGSGYAIQNLASGLANLLRLLAHASDALWPLGLAVVYIPLSTLLAYPAYYALYVRRVKGSGLSITRDGDVVFTMLVVVIAVIGIDLGIKDVVRQFPVALGTALLLRCGHLLVCAFVLFAQYQVLYGSRLLAEHEVQRHLADERERQYQISRQNIEAVNIRCHDLKHQIHELTSDGGAIDHSELAQIAKELGVYDSIVETGNAPLDTVLTEKSLLCANASITLSVIADGSALDFLQTSEVYSLFSNAMDNAIEAARRVEEPERRVISLNVFQRQGFVVIAMENYYAGDVTFDDGLPQTTKEDPGAHGFGTRSMRRIAERHGGTLTATAEGGIFKLSVLLARPGDAA